MIKTNDHHKFKSFEQTVNFYFLDVYVRRREPFEKPKKKYDISL